MEQTLRYQQKFSNFNEANMMVTDQRLYTCAFPQCPHSKIHSPFSERATRDNHQFSCPWNPSFGIPKEAHDNPEEGPSFDDLGAIGIPEEGSRVISELSSIYDNEVRGDSSIAIRDSRLLEDNSILMNSPFEDNNMLNSPSDLTDDVPVMIGMPLNMSSANNEDDEFLKAVKDGLSMEGFAMW